MSYTNPHFDELVDYGDLYDFDIPNDVDLVVDTFDFLLEFIDEIPDNNVQNAALEALFNLNMFDDEFMFECSCTPDLPDGRGGNVCYMHRVMNERIRDNDDIPF